MTTATVSAGSIREAAAPSLFGDTMGGEPTLGELIAGVWEGLAAHGKAACPVCGAAMTARYGAHARPIDGHCGTCGSTLS